MSFQSSLQPAAVVVVFTGNNGGGGDDDGEPAEEKVENVGRRPSGPAIDDDVIGRSSGCYEDGDDDGGRRATERPPLYAIASVRNRTSPIRVPSRE